jgi:Phytanoyl-CoA dioxygenase (PhyH)
MIKHSVPRQGRQLQQEDIFVLSDDKVQDLATNGFVSFDSITTNEEVSEIRSILTSLMERRAGEKEGALFDTSSSVSSKDAQRSIQMTNPSYFEPSLRKTTYVQRATRLAQELISPNAFLVGDFLLLKPAHVGTGTRWHQDEAYRDPNFVHNELSFWMPLQDTDADAGCMVFIPGSHNLGVLEHQSPNLDVRTHALECSGEFNAEDSIACPLSAGGCTIHNSRIIHRTTDNRSGTNRYAYILVFAAPQTPAEDVQSFPWLEKRRTVDGETRKRWLLHGGLLVLLMRKLRRGDFWNLTAARDSVRRGLSNMRGHRD